MRHRGTWLKKGAKNDQTTRQKERKPCATVAHYPLRTLNKPLKENSKKLQEIQDCRRASRSFESYHQSCKKTIGITNQKYKECWDAMVTRIYDRQERRDGKLKQFQLIRMIERPCLRPDTPF